MRKTFVETPRGHVVFSSPDGVRQSQRPVALMIHGTYRAPSVMFPMAERLEGLDWAFLHLPGHADAPDLDECGLAPWTEAVARALQLYLPGRTITAVGESVGALIALGLPVASIVAIEPFLRPDHIWPLVDYIAKRPARGLEGSSPFIENFLRGQDFHWLLERISAPTIVLAGDAPLMPERAQPVAPGIKEPSLLDDVDFATFAQHPMVQARRVYGGHALADQNPAACAAAVMAAAQAR